MGWADCGKDRRGRNMGYAFAAKCDKRGCKARIDRGLAYCCGGMHEGEEIELPNGETFKSCGGYFCEKHLMIGAPKRQLCEKCFAAWLKESEAA